MRDLMHWRKFSSAGAEPSARTVKKRVRFSQQEDVAQVYQWSPTKFLLFGALTDEQLSRRRQQILDKFTYRPPVSILKSESMYEELDNCMEDDVVTPKLKSPFRRVDSMNHIYNPSYMSGDADDLFDSSSSLPSAAIFSPSDEKHLLTNEQVTPANEFPLAPIRTPSRPKIDAMDTSALRRGAQRQVYVLPVIKSPAARVSEALYGCIRPCESNSRAVEHPPIVRAGEHPHARAEQGFYTHPCAEESPKFFPVLNTRSKSALSQSNRSTLCRDVTNRFALDEINLSGVQNLREEEFRASPTSRSVKSRDVLPCVIGSKLTCSSPRSSRVTRMNARKNSNERLQRTGSSMVQLPPNVVI